MADTPRERALLHVYCLLYQWLDGMGYRLDMRDAGEDAGENDRPDHEDEAELAGALAALEAIGLLTDEEARELRACADHWTDPTSADEALRAKGRAILEELLERVPPKGDVEGEAPEVDIFDGAVTALVAVGAADFEEWDARLHERTGRTSLGLVEEDELPRPGGEQRDLVGVVAGPPEEVRGVRLLYALRFADGIELALHNDAGWKPRELEHVDDAELRDDLGTEYWEGDGGGGAHEYRLSFDPAPPANASWLELTGAAERPIRVML